MDEKTEVAVAGQLGERAAAMHHHSRDNSHEDVTLSSASSVPAPGNVVHRAKRPVTPTTLGLTGWALSTTSLNNLVDSNPSPSQSRSITPRPLTDQQLLAGDLGFGRSPSFAPSPGPSLRISSLYDGPDVPSSATSLRSSSRNQSHLSLAAFLPKTMAEQDMGVFDAAAAGSSFSDGDNEDHGAHGEKRTTLPQGAIVKLHDRDDADTNKGMKRFAAKVTPLLTMISSAAYVLYVSFRIYCVVVSQRAFHQTYAPAWVFIGIELATWIPSVTHNIWTMMALKRRRRPKLRLAPGVDESIVPTVDVLITCCREDDDLVLDTVRAACDLEYPRSQYRVVLLDDGASDALQSGCAALHAIYGNVYYVARPKFPGVPHHFKSGNLNYGLAAVERLPGGAGEFVAALDADMIPERDWLRAILPHLLLNPKMALACPPQLFYNTPRSDPLAQNLDFFVHVIEPIKDALGVAWCTGSGYVVRRAALDDVGHFPLGSLAEDVATSTLMLGKGWQTAYIHEPLQFGTVPEDYGSHIKQRTRWAIGTVDTSLKLNFCLWGDAVRHMTFPQRFSGFLYSFLSLYSILFSVSLFAIPIILVMGHALIAYETENQLRWLIRLCFIALITTRINEVFLFMPAGYHTGQRGSRYQLWMSPYISLCLVRSFLLPKWLGGQTQAFQPTGSLGSALNERNPKLRRNVFVRLWTILFNYNAIYHLAFVYLTLAGVSVSTYRCISVNRDSVHDILMCLVTHAFWPPMTFLFLCTSLWTPVSYAIFPPNVPDREQLLVRDPATQVAHPTEASKSIAFGGQAAWFEFEYTLSTLYACLIFVASFIV
ncbi:hypothetical protein SCUCBS95973_002824 [Sporothrix curviconia]|uniref:Glycosyltransferase 2-like domain-containing protein n=1 Tax=Sporothrix curviconia TaxID=1260050 RepID=A0ABP0BBA6_9PEZI